MNQLSSFLTTDIGRLVRAEAIDNVLTIIDRTPVETKAQVIEEAIKASLRVGRSQILRDILSKLEAPLQIGPDVVRQALALRHNSTIDMTRMLLDQPSGIDVTGISIVDAMQNDFLSSTPALIRLLVDHPRYDPQSDPYLTEGLNRICALETRLARPHQESLALFVFQHPRIVPYADYDDTLLNAIHVAHPDVLQFLLALPEERVDLGVVNLAMHWPRDTKGTACVHVLNILHRDGRVNLGQLARSNNGAPILGYVVHAVGLREYALAHILLSILQVVGEFTSVDKDKAAEVFAQSEYGVPVLWYLIQIHPVFMTPTFLHRVLYYATALLNPSIVHHLLQLPQVDPSRVDIRGAFREADTELRIYSTPHYANRHVMTTTSYREDGRFDVAPVQIEDVDPDGWREEMEIDPPHALLLALIHKDFEKAQHNLTRGLRSINTYSFAYLVETQNYEAIVFLMTNDGIDVPALLDTSIQDPVMRFNVIHNAIRINFGVVKEYFQQGDRFSRLAPSERELIRQHVHVRELLVRCHKGTLVEVFDEWRM